MLSQFWRVEVWNHFFLGWNQGVRKAMLPPEALGENSILASFRVWWFQHSLTCGHTILVCLRDHSASSWSMCVTFPVPLSIFIFILKKLFIYLLYFILSYFWLHWVFVAAQAFSSCGERGLLFIAVRGLLIVVASLVAEHGL